MLEGEFKDHEISDLKGKLEQAQQQLQQMQQQLAASAQRVAQLEIMAQNSKKHPPGANGNTNAAAPFMDTLDFLDGPHQQLHQQQHEHRGNHGDGTSNNAKKRSAPRSLAVPTNSKKPRPVPEKTWQTMYDQLVEYKNQEGMTAKQLKSEQPDLWAWQTHQRAILNGKTNQTLNQQQIDKLKAIGIKPDSRPIKTNPHTPWDERFEELIQFQQENGHTRVTQADNPSLSNWVGTMRKALKKHGKPSGVLTPGRYAKLQAIGFEWEIKAAGNGDTWERRFQELLKYKDEHGTAHVPRSECTKLHAWCKFQRKKFNQIQQGKPCGLLTPDRIARLDAIGFPWRLSKSQFDF